MTAFTTSPRFTPAAGIASLTVATMTSPIPAYRRPEPPSTRMQRISFAPVLSATRSRDSCWITSISCLSAGSPGAAHPCGRAVPGAWRNCPARNAPQERTCGELPCGNYLLGLLEDLDDAPVLRRRQRPGLHQEDAVADTGGVLLVVGLELARAADDLAVQRVLL